ncbi:MAG: ABC transporter ATP-binding protein [Angustibacter sp.]
MSAHPPSAPSAWATVRRGLRLSPQFLQGVRVTLALAVLAAAGRVVVPFAVQQTVDVGLRADDAAGAGPDVGRVVLLLLAATAVVASTAWCAYLVNARLFQAAESGLATLRVTAFRHIHDMSALTLNAQRRGSLVSRVTSDVDTISTFVSFGGLMLVVSTFQLLVATVVMALYSPLLTLVVWGCFLPVFAVGRPLQRAVSRAFGLVRERVGDMLSAVSESVVGAATIRSYAAQARTGRRIDSAIQEHQAASVRASARVVTSFSLGVLVTGLVAVVVVVVGTMRGVGGDLTVGELLAFLFLVQLFTGPMQVGVEVLNEMQNAVAGWRRVLAVLDTPADVADPGEAGVVLPRGPIEVRFDHVSYAYPDGPTVLHDVDLRIPPGSRIAVVGSTGSGKTTLAKLLTRLMDPTTGRVLVDGVDLTQVRFSSLRERIVLVPQDGFLFDGTVAANTRFARPDAAADQLRLAYTELGLADWLDGLPHGLDTRVGQRGESLSAGERQLVALARAYLADPDLLVLDEATSAVDPATEVRIQRALDGLIRGRTSIAIAHRLSTAEAADEVLVVDAGQVVERGPAGDLVAVGGHYARLNASWVAQRRIG